MFDIPFVGVLLVMASAVTASGSPWASKMFASTSCDFGSVPQGAELEHTILLTNPYRETVHIRAVHTSCGCTSAKATQPTLERGESAGIVIRLDAARLEGETSATVNVAFDRPFTADVQLQVTATIQKDVVIDPSTIEFGSLTQGKECRQSAAIRYAARRDLRVKSVKCGCPYLSAELLTCTSDDFQPRQELRVRVHADAPLGCFREPLYLVMNDETEAALRVDAVGCVTHGVSIAPRSLSLGAVRPGQQVKKRLVVRGMRPFRIEGVECDAEGFAFDFDNTSQDLHVVEVRFTAGTIAEAVAAKVSVETDLDRQCAVVSAHAHIADD